MKLYAWLLILSAIGPLAASFDARIAYVKKWPRVFAATLLPALLFIPWDIRFTRLQYWGFEARHLSGIQFIGLPLEEVLFFVIIPFATIFIYEVIKWLIPTPPISHTRARYLCALIAIVLLVIALLHPSKHYTHFAFLFASLALICQAIGISYIQTPLFFVAYLCHLIPFLIVNGALTGAFSQQAVVWYNPTQNLNLRIATIPIEDFFYSLALLWLNLLVYEAVFCIFHRKRSLTHS